MGALNRASRLFTRLRRKALEPLLDIAVHGLRVPRLISRKIRRGQSSPKQVLRIALEHVDHKVGRLLIASRRRGLAEPRICPSSAPTPATPAPTATPAAAKVVVHGLRLLLVMKIVGSKHSDCTACGHQAP